MEEEFQEFEVIFQENNEDQNPNCVSSIQSSPELSRKRNPKRKKESIASVPVGIPENFSGYQCVDLFDEEDDGEEEIVPPHVIVGRRIYAGKVAFSVCSGTGRTLKGRDLSEVRNSILRMTGFLET